MLVTEKGDASREGTTVIPDVPAVPSGHRPALDGLRAVAVYLVVLFHAGSERFAGGFIGVDVFFVLSGYLVTQVLLRDLAAHGRVRLGRFYARRIRRLLPASLVALLGTALVVSVVFSPAEVAGMVDDFRAALLYWANWFFIRESSDYFGEQVAQSPVLHVWSLAVEEQFYVVWPLLLVGLTWVTGRLWPRRRWLATRVMVATAALASVSWALSLSVSAPNRAYYGTDTRAYQLLAGALLALSPGLLARAGRLGRALGPLTLATMGALLVLSSWIVAMGPIKRGVAVCVIAVVLIVGLEQARDGVLARTLGTPTLAHLGQISYGTYLWHWPVIIVAERLVDLGPLALAATSAVIATGLASLSATLVEQPIRRSTILDAHRFAVVAIGLVLGLVAATTVVPAVLDRPVNGGGGANANSADTPIDLVTPIPADFDQAAIFQAGYGVPLTCLGAAPERCTVHRGAGPHVLLIGDSNAVMMIQAFRRLAEEEDLTLSLAANNGCSWLRGVFRPIDDDAKRAACDAVRDDLYERVIPVLAPDVIVAIDVRAARSLKHARFGAVPDDADMRRLLADGMPELAALADDLVIIEPLPRTVDGSSPLTCLAGASFAEACRFEVSTEPFWFEEQLRRQAGEDDHVRTLDLDRTVCPLWPICDPVIDGRAVWWDGAHLTPEFSPTLEDDLARALKAEGLLPTS